MVGIVVVALSYETHILPIVGNPREICRKVAFEDEQIMSANSSE